MVSHFKNIVQNMILCSMEYSRHCDNLTRYFISVFGLLL